MALPLDILTVSEAAALIADGVDIFTRSVSRYLCRTLLEYMGETSICTDQNEGRSYDG